MERLNAAGIHPDNQDPERQEAIRRARELLVATGVTDPSPKIDRLPSAQGFSGEEIDGIELDLEWQRQSGRYVELGFHTELGLSPEDYLASLPKFEPQPEAFRGHFGIPVLVETRIAPSHQAELAGLPYHLGGLNVRDWESDPSGYRTPDSPYMTWMQDGKRNLGKSVRNVRQTLEKDERGATVYDGVAFWIKDPTVLLDKHGITLPGTSVESGHAPVLGRWIGRPGVLDTLVGDAHPRFGSASCGRVAA